MTNQVLEAFANQMLDSAINGLNEVTAKKQQEINYWKNQAQLTNQQLLILLGKRLATGEIKRELTQFGNYLMLENEPGILKVDLETGQVKATKEAKC